MPRFAFKHGHPSVITLADQARDAKQWETAARYYRRALSRDPQRAPIWIQYGHVLKEAGDLAEAEKAYRAAVAYNRSDADAHLHLGHVLKILGNEEDARAEYLRALALDPSFKSAALELTRLGWPTDHVAQLQAMASGAGSSAVRIVNGVRPDASIPVPSLAPKRKREARSRAGAHRVARLRPPNEDIALIGPYFESDGVLAQIGNDRFEIFGPVEYLSRPELWSCSPHYLFDPDWYLAQLAEPLEPATNPFLHYLRVGVHQGKAPHPLFDPQHYLAEWKQHEPDTPVYHVFDHYLGHGVPRRISPHLLFSADRYRRLHLEDASRDLDPLKHYLTDGFRRWLNPHILFDEGWYRSQATNLDPHTSGLVDYIVRGAKLDLDPHPLFKSKYFKRQDPPLQSGRTPLETYLAFAADCDPHPLFSTAHYLNQWDGASGVTPLEHYLEEGWQEGFDPHPFFRTEWYRRLSMDVSERTENPLLHYEKVGRRAGKRPNPFFDPVWYASRFMESGSMESPEEHYLTVGLAHALPGREMSPLHTGNLVRLKDIPTVPLRQASSLPSAPPQPRIGVFLHVFYPELAQEIFRYLTNVPEPCTVFISTDTPEKAQSLRQAAQGCLRHSLEIRVLPNRGRDIAPWVVGFADRMREVDIGIHLHTKKSPHASSDVDIWRRYLFNGLVGSPETVAAHLKILEYESVGASLLEHFYPLLRLGEINWGHNFELVRDLLGLCKIEISDQSPLEFPSGSMFWFKPQALAPLLQLDLRFEMFEPEIGAVDGTLAHAIERSLLYIVEASGYGWVKVSNDSRPIAGPAGTEAFDLARFLANGGFRIIPTKRRSSTLRRLLPLDLAPFNARASTSTRPRLNLVVPTIDQTLGYAGLKNGFELFFKLTEALGEKWDARILGTGHDPAARFSPPEGFVFTELGEFDWSGRSTVCNAMQRSWRFIDLRQNDMFLATAWQTAHITCFLCDEQSKIFANPEQKFIYFIQDYEPPFHPWSTLYYMADATYQRPERFHAVFNTELLEQFFKERRGIRGLTYHPAFNPEIAANVRRDKKFKNCLIYYRTYAVRNCHELCEMIVEELVNSDTRYYANWRFLAIGEGATEKIPGSYIERLGRLSLEQYGKLMSRSAVGLSLMVSPHPSYPPLEMAAAGMLVLTNTYEAKDLSELHENIVSWNSGRISDAVDQLDALCRAFDRNNEIGWEAKPKVDWFFSPTDNLDEIARALTTELKAVVGEPSCRKRKFINEHHLSTRI